MEFSHIPVLLDEVIGLLQPGPDRIYLDGTLGGGGHTAALLEAGARVVALDRDRAALETATARLGDAGGRLTVRHADFAGLEPILSELGIPAVDGVLLDIGVSSHQLDAAERGFSFQAPGPLDMRMNRDQELTARDIVNGWDESELCRVLWDYGEERRARRIVREILRARAEAPLERTDELAALIERVLPRRGDRKHPATRTFQALRIAVNRELEVLETALRASPRVLAPGGRLAVITFHSLEDRLVKHFLRDHSRPMLDRPEWPEPRPNPDCVFSLLTRKAIEPGPEELARNPRARSARLRAAERLPAAPC